MAIVGKTAALCADDTGDSVVLGTVSEMEYLTLGMSRKIWQKIALLHQRPFPATDPATSPLPMVFSADRRCGQPASR